MYRQFKMITNHQNHGDGGHGCSQSIRSPAAHGQCHSVCSAMRRLSLLIRQIEIEMTVANNSPSVTTDPVKARAPGSSSRSGQNTKLRIDNVAASMARPAAQGIHRPT